MVIKKVLNSSVVLGTDGQGNEFIVLAKGIGYGHKAGETIELNEDSQLFFPFTKKGRQDLLRLIEEIPLPYLEVTQEIVRYAEKQLHTRLNPHIYLALTDHLHFAAQRMEQNLVVTNRIFWEIKTFYSREYSIGVAALDMIQRKLGLRLPVEEAANIAFHLVNAQQEEDEQGDAMRDAKLIGQMVRLVTYFMKYEPDRESIHYSRFISHLQYFSQRFFAGKMLDSPDDFLYQQVKTGYPRAVDCAERIRTLLVKDYNVFISNEEIAYLSIHIQRLIQQD